MSFSKTAFDQSKIYKINGYKVDFSRGTIASEDSEQNIEPKVMAVLQYFVENQNKVIAQQTLFDAVWPNQIFSQSLVQRAIAILRKSLGDDPKRQLVFKTHAKKGYSFIAELTLAESNNNKAKYWPSVTLLALVILAVTAVTTIFVKDKPIKTTFNVIEPITVSPQNSYSAKYSPDGKLLAYLQDAPSQKQHIWLIELSSGQHFDLTPDGGNFKSFTWSPKGNKLAYVGPKLANNKVEIGVISLDLQAKSIINQQTLLTRNKRKYVSPIAWSKDDIWYFIDWQENISTVNAYDLNNGKLTQVIEADHSHRHFSLALSPDQSHLALSSNSNSERFQVGTFNLLTHSYYPLTKVISQQLSINWHPDSQHLLLNSEISNQFINLKGEAIDVNLAEFMQPNELSISPLGETIIYTQNTLDSDIITIDKTTKHIDKVVDTNAIDISARYAPDSQSIAYLSKRKGYMQVFTSHAGQERLIYSNPEKVDIFGPPVWSHNGKQVVVAQQQKLIFINTDTLATKVIPIGHKNMFIYGWYHNENALLVGFLTNDGVMAKKFNIESHQLSLLVTNKSGGFKLNTNDQLLFISDNNLTIGKQTFSLPISNNEVISNAVKPLANGIVLQSSIGNKVTVWLFDPTTKQRETLMALPEDVWRLEDITSDGNQYLFTSEMTNRKNIMQVN